MKFKWVELPRPALRRVGKYAGTSRFVLPRAAVRLEDLVGRRWTAGLQAAGYTVIHSVGKRWTMTGLEDLKRARWRSERVDQTVSYLGRTLKWLAAKPRLETDAEVEPWLVHVPELGFLSVVLRGTADDLLLVIRPGVVGLKPGEFVASSRYRRILKKQALRLMTPATAAPDTKELSTFPARRQ